MDKGAESYRRFLGGDDRGLAELVEAYKDGLILYLNGYVNNIFAAEELAEDTFFRLIVKKPRFSGKSSFKTWLYAIGRNVAVDELRRHRRCMPTADVEECRRETQCMEEAYLGEERRRVVHRALSALSPDYRAVVWLVYFEGFSGREAAVILKKSDRQIRNLLYRAKQALREKLEQEGIFDEEF